MQCKQTTTCKTTKKVCKYRRLKRDQWFYKMVACAWTWPGFVQRLCKRQLTTSNIL